MPYLKILKNLLKYKYILFSFIIVIMSIIYTSFEKDSKYSIDTNHIEGYIDSYKIDGDKLSIEIIGLENIIGTYYFDNNIQINNFKNEFNLGDYVSIECVLNIPKDGGMFNQFSYRKYLKQNNIHLLMKIDKIKKIKNNDKFRYRLKDSIIDRIERIELSKKYLYAFIIGEEYYIDSNVKDSYQKNGISHLFAVSGSNITFVVALLLKLIEKFKYKYILIFLYVLIYMFLTDFTASIVRSGIFFILVTLNKILKTNLKMLDLMMLTLSISLIYNPYLLYSVGYQFSFIISAYLILFQNKINKYKSFIGNLFIVSFVAFLSSLPIVLNNFYEFNLLSIVFNLIYVPFVSFILFPLSLICFIFPFFDNLLFFLTNILEISSLFFSNIDLLSFVIGKPNYILIILYYIVITLLLFKIKYVYLLLVLLFINKSIHYANFPSVEFMDVGQGDSILIRLTNNKNILIDTGGVLKYETEYKKANEFSIGRDRIIPYLKSIGLSSIDYMILTHGDMDHIGGAFDLVNDFKIENVIFNCGEVNDLEKELKKVLENKNIKYHSCIKELNVEKYNFQFLNNKDYDNENDNSIVIYTKINNHKFLFMGDASSKVEEDIISKYNISDIDFLKVGHHGSYTSSSEEFIDSINPKYSLISVGENNRFGHPKESVLDILDDSKIYRTDLDGSIEIKLNKKGYKIRSCSPW